jgi:hypothetical protein
MQVPLRPNIFIPISCPNRPESNISAHFSNIELVSSRYRHLGMSDIEMRNIDPGPSLSPFPPTPFSSTARKRESTADNPVSSADVIWAR